MKKFFTLVAVAFAALAMNAAVQQYEVAAAIAAYDAKTIKDSDSIAVRGVISKIEFKGKNFAKYGSANIYVKDATGATGSWEYFSCYSLDADTFKTSTPAYDATSESWKSFTALKDANGREVAVGDTVVAEGKVLKYKNTYELLQSCHLTSVKKEVKPEPQPVVIADTITVAKAIELGMKLDSMKTDSVVYAVEGYVINAFDFNLNFMNQSWYMADDAADTVSSFEAYNCFPIEGEDTLKVLKGDKVQLVGKLKKYYNKNAKVFIIEIEKGNATFISKAEGDHSVDKGAEKVTVAKALEIAGALETGKTTAKQYEVTGYVTAMTGSEADGGWAKYGNQMFWIADEQGSTAITNADGALEVYQGKADEEVKVGYKISVKAQLQNYQGLLETVKGGAVTILEKAPEPKPEYPEGVISCDSAVVLAKAIADPTAETKTVEGPQVKVWGYVTYAFNASEKDGVVKQSAWLSDTKGSKNGVLQGAYLQIASMEAAVAKEDFVEIEGTLAKYYKDAENIVIEVINGTMKKVGDQGIENIVLTEKAQKVMVDGVVYIIRDNKMYNVVGTRVR